MNLLHTTCSKKTKFESGSNPIIFFIGDEKPYYNVSASQAESFGIEFSDDKVEPFGELRKKVHDNVFMLLNKACGKEFRQDITARWEKLLAPQHVIKIREEKSIVDLMLGIISMVSSTRTLETYKVDMLDRGQTKARIENVSKSLEKLSSITDIVPVKVSGTITKTEGSNKSIQKGKRL